jgi:hypothetical protein
VTDLEQKNEKVLALFTKIILNMTQLEDMISIETPTFLLIYKKINSSSLQLDMMIEKNTFQLPELVNLISNNSQINDNNLILLKVNLFDHF